MGLYFVYVVVTILRNISVKLHYDRITDSWHDKYILSFIIMFLKAKLVSENHYVCLCDDGKKRKYKKSSSFTQKKECFVD